MQTKNNVPAYLGFAFGVFLFLYFFIPNVGADKHRAYTQDAKSNLYNIYLACKAYWDNNRGTDVCTVAIAKMPDFGYFQSTSVVINIADGTEDGFLAYARHLSLKKAFEINKSGAVVESSITESSKFYPTLLSEGTRAELIDLADKAYEAKNYDDAYRKYLRLARYLGDAEAQGKVGWLEERGLSLPSPNYEVAVHWYTKSAEQGYAMAQINLGMLYIRGEGVTQNSLEAYKWFYIAEENGEADGKMAREKLERQMTNAQIAEAQELAREWMEEYPNK